MVVYTFPSAKVQLEYIASLNILRFYGISNIKRAEMSV